MQGTVSWTAAVPGAVKLRSGDWRRHHERPGLKPTSVTNPDVCPGESVLLAYRAWVSAQQAADQLRAGLFGVHVRNSDGRQGNIYRITGKGLFVRYDGAVMEERARPEDLEMLTPGLPASEPGR